MSEGDSAAPGTLYSIAPVTGAEAVVYSFLGQNDGKNPVAGLLAFRGKLYGVAQTGGGQGCDNVGCGTLFVLNPDTGAEKVVHSFQGGSDGAYPLGGLIEVGGTLYGTTSEGGASNNGTVFTYTP
jgi:uncharacterized repeat protein (TIGR03803 family)